MKRNSKGKGKGTPKGKKGTPKSRKVNTKFEGKSIQSDEDARPDVRNGHAGDNDPAWYGVSGQLVDDTARLSFNHPAGIPHTVIPFPMPELVDDSLRKENIPGIMALNYLYGPGVSRNNTSPINLAAKNIYTFVRHVNSGASNYEAPDLMIYIMSIISAFALYADIVRAYGVCRNFQQSNMYTPASLTYALGYNYKDLVGKLPQLRTALNVFVRKIGARPIPANLNIIKRIAWACSNIFTDAESNKSQYYFYKPIGHYYYDEETYSDEYTGGKCVFKQRMDLAGQAGVPDKDRSLWTVEAIEAILDYVGDKIYGSEDLGIISGDIVKAYGQNVYQFSEIGDDFTIVPVHSAEALSQIHNIHMVGTIEPTSCNIEQDPSIGFGPLLWKPKAYTSIKADSGTGATDDPRRVWGQQNLPLDMWQDVPSPDEVMVATRCMGRWDPDFSDWHVGSSQLHYYLKGGIEFISDATLYRLDNDANLDVVTIKGDEWITAVNTVDQHGSAYAMSLVEALTKFDWHPIVRWWLMNVAPTTDGSKIQRRIEVGDFDNVIYISDGILENMDRTAVLSLWDVPETAFYKG